MVCLCDARESENLCMFFVFVKWKSTIVNILSGIWKWWKIGVGNILTPFEMDLISELSSMSTILQANCTSKQKGQDEAAEES